MTDRFVDDVTPGSNTSPYTSWATAALLINSVDGVDTAGDQIHVAHNHDESTASSVDLDFAGTPASPTKLVSVTSGTSTKQAGARIAVTGTASFAINGTLYAYGITWDQAEASVVIGNISVGGSDTQNEHQIYDSCTFKLQNTYEGGEWNIGTNSTDPVGGTYEFLNCTFQFGHVNNGFHCNLGNVLFKGGGLSASGVQQNTFIKSVGGTWGNAKKIIVDGFDFANGKAALNLSDASTYRAGSLVIFRNCKMPASWTGSPATGSFPGPGCRAQMIRCDNADTNYRLWIEDYAGSIKSETTIVRSSGASDGTTALAWKMSSSANVAYPVVSLESPEIKIWNEAVGSAKTVDVEIVHDSQGAGAGADFQNNEVWLEVQYLGTSGFPRGSFVSSRMEVFASAADIANSSVTWTTTGLTTPVKQKLSVTFTPQEKGEIVCRVHLAKASKTLYVCPKPTVT